VSYDPAADRWTRSPLLDESDQPLRLDPGAPLARLADQVATIRRADGKVQLLLIDLTGHLVSVVDVDILDTPADQQKAERLLEYMIWAVMIALLVPMVLLRRRPAQPLVLPEGAKPSNPLRRLVAWVVDILPFSMIGQAIFPVDSQALLDQFSRSGAEMHLPVEFAWYTIFTLASYTTYATLMELRLGQTLGKRLLKIRVIGSGGRRPDIREALMRNLVRVIELAPPLGPFLLGLPLLTRFRQRMGDLLAQTVVVDADSVPPTPAGEVPGPAKPAPSDHPGENGSTPDEDPDARPDGPPRKWTGPGDDSPGEDRAEDDSRER
jgi:uncharacterized RDD family membrane protein YckC